MNMEAISVVNKASYKSVEERLDMSWRPCWRGNLISLRSFQSETPQGSDREWLLDTDMHRDIHRDIQCCALLFCSAWTILFKWKRFYSLTSMTVMGCADVLHLLALFFYVRLYWTLWFLMKKNNSKFLFSKTVDFFNDRFSPLMFVL